MSDLLVAALGALLATNQPAAVSNLVLERTGMAVHIADPNDPVEKEYRKLLSDDDAAQAEIDRWIQENEKFREKGVGLAEVTLRPRIQQRQEQVRKAYENFVQLHPRHANGRVAYASFLSDIGEEEAMLKQLEAAKEVEPKNPAVWNNLGNYHGHNGGATNALACYLKAIELAPRQSVYYQNLAINTYLFRKEAQAFFGLDEPRILNKVMALYRKALALDPENFILASELAQTYYGFKPPPPENLEATLRAEQKHYDEALEAWQVALRLARDDIEREGIYVHLARVNSMAGRFEESQRTLSLVTNAMFTTVKERLQRNLTSRDTKALSAPPPSLRPLPSEAGAGPEKREAP